MPRMSLLARAYAADFERRFVETADGTTLFHDDDGGVVTLPDDMAARLIAAMRATLDEAAGRSLLRGSRIAGAMLVGAIGPVVVFGLIGLSRLGAALAWPGMLAVLLLGPGLDAFRIDAAAARGRARAQAATAGFERRDGLGTRGRPVASRLRPAAQIAAIAFASVILGLVAAYLSLSFYARVEMERGLSRLMAPVLLLLIVLTYLARAADTIRQPVAEAAVAAARRERRDWPFR